MERDQWYGYLIDTVSTDIKGQFVVSMSHFCGIGIVEFRVMGLHFILEGLGRLYRQIIK